MTYRKYHNKPTADGHASRKEGRRAAQLRLLQQAGLIRDLREQVRFELIPSQRINGRVVLRPCHYVADFVYYDCELGREVVLSQVLVPIRSQYAQS